MKNFLFLFLVMVAFSDSIYAQQVDLEKFMQEKIIVLKEGALLVRLQTKENSIAALRKAGDHASADKVAAKQIKYNKELINAFKTEYKFSPVYFFPSNYSESILAGKMSEVVFFNDSLLPDPNIKFAQKDFLTAEAGPLDPDTAFYFEGHHYDYSGKNLQEKETYYGGTNMGFEVIKMMNKEFIQLKQPFPYYVRLYDSLPMERSLPKAVGILNKKLKQYYDLVKK